MAVIIGAKPNGKRIEYRKFIQANVEENHNKFWNVALFDSDDVEVEYGRVDVTFTQGVEPGGGLSYMEKKIQEKLRGKMKKGKRECYKEIKTLDTTGIKIVDNKTSLKEIAKKQIIHDNSETERLIGWLAEVNRHNITKASGGNIVYDNNSGLFQTPMGIITPEGIKEARKHLVTIGDFVAQKKYNLKKLTQAVNEYLMLVPTNTGMKLNIEALFPDVKAVQKQGQLLDALDASYVEVTQDKAPVKDSPEDVIKLFEAKLSAVEDGKVFDRINKLYTGTVNKSHYAVQGLKIHKIWIIEIPTMRNAFKTKGEPLGNVHELWHGTQASNLLSILKGGLVIPPSSSPHVTGRMFGDGIYASSQSTKALNYATSFWGGQDVGRYFMFLLKMAMGNTYIPNSTRYGYSDYSYPKKGYDSTWAKPGTVVHNDERIVYKEYQVDLEFLAEFRK